MGVQRRRTFLWDTSFPSKIKIRIADSSFENKNITELSESVSSDPEMNNDTNSLSDAVTNDEHVYTVHKICQTVTTESRGETEEKCYVRVLGLNSNKGTKCDMAISLIPFDRLDFRTLGSPQNGAPFSPPILGVEFRFCLAASRPRSHTRRAG